MDISNIDTYTKDFIAYVEQFLDLYLDKICNAAYVLCPMLVLAVGIILCVSYCISPKNDKMIDRYFPYHNVLWMDILVKIIRICVYVIILVLFLMLGLLMNGVIYMLVYDGVTCILCMFSLISLYKLFKNSN